MADKSGKTEQPTQQRLKKAREQGQFPAAKEFVAALQFMVFLSLLGAGGAAWFGQFRLTARSMLRLAFTPELLPEDLIHVAWQLFWRNLLPLALAGAGVSIATVAFRLATTQFGISLKKLMPGAQRFSPIAHVQNLLKQNLPSLGQALVLLPMFLWAVWVVARDKLDTFLALPVQSVESGFSLIGTSLMELFWKAAAVFLMFGCVDLAPQPRRHKSELRMSKQEIRDEMKDVEGNPQMKARIRRLQRDRLRKQMMKEVPKATAVVVNPTHFAVAIRYHMDSMAAPLVVAKGRNFLALRIRQIAIENQVPIVENPPLAQALFQSVEVGQEIPPHLYRAVAEILAYIFKLMNGRLPSKTHDTRENHGGAGRVAGGSRISRPGARAGARRVPPVGGAAGGAGDCDCADHAAAQLRTGPADRDRSADVDHRHDGLAVPGAAGRIHVVPHHAAVADLVPAGAEHLVFAVDPAERKHRDHGRR